MNDFIGKVVYPYPPTVLSPNSREHWSKVAKEKKIARHDAHYLTKISGVKIDASKKVTLSIVFRPSTKCRYDIDNALARCKAMIDGIADALGVDDHNFEYRLARGEPFKGGAVEVTFIQ